jgi:Uma2 family endonuclease
MPGQTLNSIVESAVTPSLKSTLPHETPSEPARHGAVHLPPLETGDCLTRDEFERRYEAMDELKKAELIEGVVHLPSPVRVDVHGSPHFDLIAWLSTYRIATPGTRGADNSSVRLDLENVVQPDVLLMIEPARGGQARIDQDGFIAGPPELVCEVSATSASIDLNAKLRIYRRNQVREYLVWRVFDRAVDWFVLRGSDFSPLDPDSEGVIRSEVFPGLWLHAPALLAGDLARVNQALPARKTRRL